MGWRILGIALVIGLGVSTILSGHPIANVVIVAPINNVKDATDCFKAKGHGALIFDLKADGTAGSDYTAACLYNPPPSGKAL